MTPVILHPLNLVISSVQACYGADAKRFVRDLSEDAQKFWNEASDQVKGVFTPENWDVSRKRMLEGTRRTDF